MNQCNSNCHSCDISNTEIVLDQCITNVGTKAIDNICNTENINSCPIPYIDSDIEYVCPKVTEITECSQGGISGYTTYQLSLIIKDPAIQNIYAMYGSDLQNKPLVIPSAYQGNTIFNSNLGGISPELINIDHNAFYDSWLTIGLTNGDPNNLLSTIGIDFNSWTEDNSLYITNGAVFVMDPEISIVPGNEYIIAQLTIPNEVVTDVLINVQGKLTCVDCPSTWKQEDIHFHLEKPKSVNPNYIPSHCISWFDGCNTCSVINGELRGCSRLMCFRESTPYCINFDRSGH